MYLQNRYLNHLVGPSFQRVKRRFVLSFKNEDGRISHSNYYPPKVAKKNVKDDDKNVFDQPINDKFKTYENIRKIVTGKGDD